jgi:hypothetical protein
MTWRRWLFAVALLGTLIAALLPGSQAPDLGAGDKINHIVAFVTLAVIAAAAWPRARLWQIGGVLSAFGGAIEGLQALPAIARDAEWADWVADTTAVVVALVVVAAIRWLRATSSGA